MPEAAAVALAAPAPAPAPSQDVAAGGSSGGDVGARAGATDFDASQLKTVALQPDASPKLKLHLPTPPLAGAALPQDPPSYALNASTAVAGAPLPPSGQSSAANSVSSSPAPSAPATPEQHHELVAVHVDVMPQPLPAPLSAAPPPPGYAQKEGGSPPDVQLGSGYGYGYNRQPQYVVVQPSRVYIEDDPTCAQCGCAFAVCFPIVGCITYCVNADAPFGTQRRKWARLALSTALIAFILGILLVWFTSAPPENQ